MAACPARSSLVDRVSRIGVASLLACLLLVSDAVAGAWLQPEREWVVITTATYETTDQLRDGSGAVVDAPDFSKFQLRSFAEYGWRRWLTVGISPDWQRIRQDVVGDDALRASGLASVDLHARVGLRRWRHSVLSAQTTLIVPAGLDTVDPFFAANATPVSDRFGAELRLLGGRGGLGPQARGFLDAQIAVRANGAPAQDELRYDLAGGWGDPRELMIMAQLFGIEGIGGANAPAIDFDLQKLRLGVTRSVSDRLALQVALERAVGGHSTTAGGALVLGLWWWP